MYIENNSEANKTISRSCYEYVKLYSHIPDNTKIISTYQLATSFQHLRTIIQHQQLLSKAGQQLYGNDNIQRCVTKVTSHRPKR
jgi:hypothetical protein